MTPTDAVRHIGQRVTILTFVFCIIRFRAVVAAHRFPACSLDNVVQLTVQEHAATLLCTPATA